MASEANVPLGQNPSSPRQSNMSNKRPRISHEKTVVNIWEREVGQLSNRNFAHRLAASQDLVLRLGILRKLEKHRGCVNTVSFNAVGDILISGSDDMRVILWDWEAGCVKLSFHSGHIRNVFQAKIMPLSDDRSIITCAADGQVRHAEILDSGAVKTSLLGTHGGRAHKMAIEPGSPHVFYSCGEDGLVQHFDLRTKAATQLFKCRSIPQRRSYLLAVHLNAIAVDPRKPNLFAVAGKDEYTRLYDIRKYQWSGSTDFDQPVNYFCPQHLIGDEQVGITGLAFSDQSELLVSYNDEHIYLFTQDMGLGPSPILSGPTCSDGEKDADDFSEASLSGMETDEKPEPQVYKGHKNCATVKGVSFFGPKCEYVVSGSDCGRIFIWKKKDGELLRAMEADKHIVNCIESHPHCTVLASSGIENDIKIWTPNAEERATLPPNIHEVKKGRIQSFFPFGDYDYEDDFFDDDLLNGDDNYDDDDDENEDEDDDENEDEDDGGGGEGEDDNEDDEGDELLGDDDSGTDGDDFFVDTAADDHDN